MIQKIIGSQCPRGYAQERLLAEFGVNGICLGRDCLTDVGSMLNACTLSGGSSCLDTSGIATTALSETRLCDVKAVFSLAECGDLSGASFTCDSLIFGSAAVHVGFTIPDRLCNGVQINKGCLEALACVCISPSLIGKETSIW